MELTDKQWIRREPIILPSVCQKDTRGRKPRDYREVLNGILFSILFRELAVGLQERGGIDIREAFIDGSFVPAKKWAMRSVGQNEPDHGNYGRCRSSCRRLPCKCFDS